jgi:hypothetical protein
MLASLRRTRETVQRVIEDSEQLRAFPGHEASAEARIIEGERELAEIDAQIAAVERGDEAPASEPEAH